MAVRFNADTDWVSLAVTIGGAGHVNFALGCWLYFEEFNDSAGILAAGHLSNGRTLGLGCNNSFPTPLVCLGDSQTGFTSGNFATQPSLNGWVYAEFSSPNTTGGTVTARYSPYGSDTVYTVTRTNGVEASVQAQVVHINRFAVGNANGFTGGLRAAYLRGYSGPTADDAAFLAHKADTSGAGTLFFNPLANNTDTSDISGNGRTVTFNGTLTTEDSPVLGGGSAPAITSVSDTTPAHGSSLTITGTNFGATQGAGTVEIEGDAQAVTSWSDTSIVITVDRGLSKYGVAVDLVVTDDAAAASDPFALTSLTPPSGWAFIDLTTPNATAANRITATADLASGDQLAYETIGSTVTVFADATFSVSGATTEFDVEVWTSPDGWGAVATQTLSSATIISVDGTSAASGQAAAAVVALAQASGATTAAGQAAAAAAALAASSAASDAAGQASGAIVALAAAEGAADAAAQAAAGPVLVGRAEGSSQAPQAASAPAAAIAASTGAAAGSGQAAAPVMAVAAADGSSAAPAPASAPAAAIASAAGASAAPSQAVGDTGASTVVSVDGIAAASSQAAAAVAAIAAADGAAAALAPAAAPAFAIVASSGASEAPAQATAEPGSGSIVAVDGASYGAAPAVAAVRAIASAAATGAAIGQAAADILATASVDGVAQAAAQASAPAVGRITIAVDGASAAPGQAASPQGEDVVPPAPAPQPGGVGRLVTPSYKLPKKLRKRRIVAVDAIAASSSAHATASVAAIVAVAGASAAAAQHGTADLPVGSMVADQWLAARMQELEFERTMLEHI